MRLLLKLLLLTIPLLHSCVSDTKRKVSKAPVIDASLEITALNKLKKCYLSYPGSDTILLVEEGEASIRIPLKASTYIDLVFDDSFHTEIYLDPGSDLTMEIDREITFSGRGAESNTYLQKYQRFVQANNLQDISRFEMDPDSFKDALRHDRIKSGAFLKHYQSKAANLDPKFMERERARIEYTWINDMMAYPALHQAACTCEFDPDEEFTQVYNQGSFSEPHLISLKPYREFLLNTIMWKAQVLTADKGESRASHAIALDLISDELDNDHMKDMIQYELLKDAMYLPIQDWHETLLDVFNKRCDNYQLTSHISKIYTHKVKEETAMDISAK